MKIRLLILFSFLIINKSALCQQTKIDSLNAIIFGKTQDTSRITALYDILNYLPLNECEFYNDKTIELSEIILKKEKNNSIKFKRFASIQAESYYNKGVFLSNRNKIDSALIFYQKGLNAYLILKNEQMQAYSYMNMAIIYTTKASFSRAINLLYKALAINEKNKDFEGIGDTYMHIGRIYHMQKNYNVSYDFMNKAYLAYIKAKYNPGILEVLFKLAQVKTDMHQFHEAMIYLNKSIKLSNELKIKDQNKQEQMLYDCKGYIAFQKNECDSVIYYIKKSINLAKASKNTYLLGNKYLLISRAYYKQNKYANAEKYANMGLEIGIETKDIDLQWNLTKLLTQIYKADNKPKLALDMQDLYIKLNDSLKNESDKKNMIEQQLKYEFDKKTLLENVKHEKEIDTITHNTEKNNLKKNIGILILCLSIISISIIAYLIYKQQKQNTIIEKQKSNLLKQKMLVSQMNPHFIFNSINSIQNYVLQKKEIDAYSYLAKFSKLIRMVLNNSNKNQILLYEEIDLLKTYIEIEQLRFENAFDYIVEVDDDINEQEFSIPPMLIQPFVENAIWHGIMNIEKERKGKLILKFELVHDLLKITIEDNGIGRLKSQLYKTENHQPLAMNLTEQRLSVLHELTNKAGIKITINDLHDKNGNASGTKVEIYLPDKLSI